MTEMIKLAGLGAFIYGAVFFFGLIMAGGNAALCGLIGAGAGYFAQVGEAYRLAGVRGAGIVMATGTFVSITSGLVGLAIIVGG
jgi:hypothetical protein